MFFSLFHHQQTPPPYRPVGSVFLAYGILAIFFGMLIIIEPDLVAYIIGLLCILIGASMVGIWWKMKK